MRWLDSITNSVDKNLRTPRETLEDTGAWGAAIHAVPKSRTQLSTFHFHVGGA